MFMYFKSKTKINRKKRKSAGAAYSMKHFSSRTECYSKANHSHFKANHKANQFEN